MPHTTQVSTVSDTEILIARRFDAPRRLVFDCLKAVSYTHLTLPTKRIV